MSSRSLKRSNTIGSPGRNHSRYVQKLNMGEARDDVHVCIMCLRAIMNHQVRKKTLTHRILGPSQCGMIMISATDSL